MSDKNKPIEEISNAFLEGEIELPVPKQASKPSMKSYDKATSKEQRSAFLLQQIREEVGAMEINATKVNDTINITADATDYYHISLVDMEDYYMGYLSLRDIIKVGYKYPYGW